MEVCCGGIVGMGESLEQRAELAGQLAELDPDEVPLNFLDPRPGTPFAHLKVTDSAQALRAIVGFRLALPRTVLRFAGGGGRTPRGPWNRPRGVGGGNPGVIATILCDPRRPPPAD